jgi:hypothetical protein
MISCGASIDGVIYGVFRGPLYEKNGEPDYISLSECDRVATYRHPDGPLDAPLFEMSQRHATDLAPAFEWERVQRSQQAHMRSVLDHKVTHERWTGVVTEHPDPLAFE